VTFPNGELMKIRKLLLVFSGRQVKMLGKLLLTVFVVLTISRVDGLIEDVIDVLHLGREVIKTISSTWELAEQTGVTNEIDLPFMQRKEKKIISRMAELTQEFRAAEMNVIKRSFDLNCRFTDSLIAFSGSRIFADDDAGARVLHPHQHEARACHPRADRSRQSHRNHARTL
jgi:hypothetical protein